MPHRSAHRNRVSEAARYGAIPSQYTSDYFNLFSVNFLHDYYNTSEFLCPDLQVQPTAATEDLMASFGLLSKATPTGFSVFCDLNRVEQLFNFLSWYGKQAGNYKTNRATEPEPEPVYWVRLSFLLAARNTNFLSWTALDAEFLSEKKILYLSNLQRGHADGEDASAPGSALKHTEIPKKETASSPSAPPDSKGDISRQVRSLKPWNRLQRIEVNHIEDSDKNRKRVGPVFRTYLRAETKQLLFFDCSGARVMTVPVKRDERLGDQTSNTGQRIEVELSPLEEGLISVRECLGWANNTKQDDEDYRCDLKCNCFCIRTKEKNVKEQRNKNEGEEGSASGAIPSVDKIEEKNPNCPENDYIFIKSYSRFYPFAFLDIFITPPTKEHLHMSEYPVSRLKPLNTYTDYIANVEGASGIALPQPNSSQNDTQQNNKTHNLPTQDGPSVSKNGFIDLSDRIGRLTYQLSFPTRSVFWLYYIISIVQHARLDDVKLDGLETKEYEYAIALPTGEPAILLASTKRIALTEKKHATLRLTATRVSDARKRTPIEISSLPVASRNKIEVADQELAVWLLQGPAERSDRNECTRYPTHDPIINTVEICRMFVYV